MSTRTPKIGWTEGGERSRAATLGAEAANDPKPDEDSLRDIVQRTRLLLDAAHGRGLTVGPAITEAINRIEREIETDVSPSMPSLAEFLKASDALWRLMGGVSTDALSAEARSERRRTRRIYFLSFALLMLIAVPLTTISTVGGGLSTDIVTQISSTCRDYPVLYCDPSTRNEETSYDHYPYAVHDLTSRTSHISESLWILAFFDDLLQPDGLSRELIDVSPAQNSNVWSSFLETFYRSGTIIDRFKLYYGTLADYLLPIVFGMLGAVTFGLRHLLRRNDSSQLRTRDGAMMAILRICIAGLAGYLVTVTGDFFAGMRAPSIFIAFLLGYSIDVFFALLDKAVLRVRAINAPQRPRTGRG